MGLEDGEDSRVLILGEATPYNNGVYKKIKKKIFFHHQAGETRHNDKLEDFTLERFEADNESCKSFLKRAEAMLRGGSLTEADTLNLRLFKAELETFISGYTCQGSVQDRQRYNDKF